MERKNTPVGGLRRTTGRAQRRAWSRATGRVRPIEHPTRAAIGLALALALVVMGAWWVFDDTPGASSAAGSSRLGPNLGGFDNGGRSGLISVVGGPASPAAGPGSVAATGHVGASIGSVGAGSAGTGHNGTGGSGSSGSGSGSTSGTSGTGGTGHQGSGSGGSTPAPAGSHPAPSPSPGHGSSSSSHAPSLPSVTVSASAGSGSGGVGVQAGAGVDGPSGSVTSLVVTACTVGLTKVSASATVRFSNGYTASSVPVLGLSLSGLTHPTGLHVSVKGSTFAVPAGASVSLHLCL